MAKKGDFELELNSLMKLIGIILVIMLLFGVLNSFILPYISGAAEGLSRAMGFGSNNTIEYQRDVFPRDRADGSLNFKVNHQIYNDVAGGDEIKFVITIKNNMQTGGEEIRVKLSKDGGGRAKVWPGAGEWVEVGEGAKWEATYNTDWSLQSRGAFDGSESWQDHAYNVTLEWREDDFSPTEVIAFYNATDDQVPDPKNCWICV